MAKYYELDVICEEFSDILHISERDIEEILENTPTADVVPRSEVERLTIELEAMRGVSNSYKLHYEQAQAEKDNLIATYEACMRTYAEQLFEEIENKPLRATTMDCSQNNRQ